MSNPHDSAKSNRLWYLQVLIFLLILGGCVLAWGSIMYHPEQRITLCFTLLLICACLVAGLVVGIPHMWQRIEALRQKELYNRALFFHMEPALRMLWASRTADYSTWRTDYISSHTPQAFRKALAQEVLPGMDSLPKAHVNIVQIAVRHALSDARQSLRAER